MSTNTLSVAERLQALGACPVFTGTPSTELGLLAEIVETEQLEAGETLFEAGEPSDRVYLVASGTLNVLVPGKAEPVRQLGPSELLGEYGMFCGLVRTATIRAATEAVLLSLDYQRFRAFLLQSPEAALVLLKTAAQRLVAAEAAKAAPA